MGECSVERFLDFESTADCYTPPNPETLCPTSHTLDPKRSEVALWVHDADISDCDGGNWCAVLEGLGWGGGLSVSGVGPKALMSR